jgi:hypothetical protein
MQRNGSKLIKNKGLISYTNMFECKINKKKKYIKTSKLSMRYQIQKLIT